MPSLHVPTANNRRASVDALPTCTPPNDPEGIGECPHYLPATT